MNIESMRVSDVVDMVGNSLTRREVKVNDEISTQVERRKCARVDHILAKSIND